MADLGVRDYKVLYWSVTCILALLVASPALSRLLVYPRTEFFTELWLLGPGHLAQDYPYNITRNQQYTIYLGLGNHLGYCARYLVQVKFRNLTQPAADSFDNTPSSVPALYNLSVFVPDEQVVERLLTFSFNYVYYEGSSLVRFLSLSVNDISLSLQGYMAEWNSTRSEFYGNLFFEAWIYNSALGDFEYHERFVGLRFNMTVS